MTRPYVVITPVRDELANLRRLLASIEGQTVRPAAWVVVDTGSSDASADAIRLWATDRPWIHLIRTPAVRRSRGGLVASAIEVGLREFDAAADIVVKVDADVSFAHDYFERLLTAFERDPQLGIASGRRLEWVRGRWREQRVTGTSVQAQCRAYRRACLDEVLPFEKHMGWDGIDEIKANLRGWRTAVFGDLAFRHHRPVGGRERSRFAARWREGQGAYYMGYRPSYLLARALFYSPSDPAALALIPSFIRAALVRAPQCPEPQVRGYLRYQQSPLRLPLRAAEALGIYPRHRRAARLGILLVADPGGHLSELIGLREVWRNFSRAWVTVGRNDTSLLGGEQVFLAHGPTRRNLWNLSRNILFAVRVVGALRPAVILTTGAGLSVPFSWVGRIFGARVIYVECSGRIGVSLSGRAIAPLAHRLYVQWPEVVPLLRRSRYRGSIFFSLR